MTPDLAPDLRGLMHWRQGGELMLLFTLAWLLASRLWSSLRLPFGLIITANLLSGLSMLLMGWSDLLPHALGHALPTVLQAACYSVLWMMGMTLIGQPIPLREPALTALAYGLPVLWFGLSPSTDVEREVVGNLGNAWVALRGGWQVVQRMRAGGYEGSAWLVALMNLAAAGAMIVRVFALLSTDGRSDSEWGFFAWMAIVFVPVVFTLNMVLAYTALGRLLRQIDLLSQDEPGLDTPGPARLDRALAFEWRRWRQHGERPALLTLVLPQWPAIVAQHGQPTAQAVMAELLVALRLALPVASVLAHQGQGVVLALVPQASPTLAQRLALDLARVAASQAGLHPELGAELGVDVSVTLVEAQDDSAQALRRRALAGRPVAGPDLPPTTVPAA